VKNIAAATLVAKSGAPDLGFGWEPTPATTLTIVVPRQVGWKVSVGEVAWRGTTSDALSLSKFVQ
jgi:hypothetical protein